MIVLFQAKRGEKMKAKNMKAEIVKVIRHCRRKRDRRKSSTQREKILDFRRRTDFRADIDGRNSWEEKF